MIKIFFLLFLALPLLAQPSDLVINFGMSQSAVSDWRKGETSGFDFSNSIKLNNTFRLDTFKFRLRMNYGIGAQYIYNSKDDYEYFLPSDNKFDIEGVLIYPLGWKLDPCISGQLNTSLTESFMIVKGEKIATSKLWDPVTTQQSFGFEYSNYFNRDYFTSRIGLSWKQIRAERYTKMTDDYKTRDVKERYKEQTGIQWKTDAKFELDSNITYRGTLDTFSSFEDMKKWAIKFSNQFNLKVFKAVGIVIQLNFVYDEKQLAKLQYNQKFRFGITLEP